MKNHPYLSPGTTDLCFDLNLAALFASHCIFFLDRRVCKGVYLFSLHLAAGCLELVINTPYMKKYSAIIIPYTWGTSYLVRKDELKLSKVL